MMNRTMFFLMITAGLGGCSWVKKQCDVYPAPGAIGAIRSWQELQGQLMAVQATINCKTL